MRKTIYIQKGSDFSRRSRVAIVMNGTKMFLPDYKPLRINLKKDEALQISYMWVKSKRLDYNLFQNGKHYVINQLLGKREGFLFFILFSLCIVLFFVTNLVWFVIPILGIGIYILLSVSILSDCYLRLKSINEM